MLCERFKVIYSVERPSEEDMAPGHSPVTVAADGKHWGEALTERHAVPWLIGIVRILITSKLPYPTECSPQRPGRSKRSARHGLRVLGRRHRAPRSVDSDRTTVRQRGDFFVALRAIVVCLLKPVAEAGEATKPHAAAQQDQDSAETTG